MKKIIKILITSSFIIGVITLIILIGIIRCKLDKLNKLPVTYEDGFDRRLPEDWANSIFLTAVKSDTRIFDVNDVTLDFYMGHRLNVTDHGYFSENEKYKCISICTYFYIESEIFQSDYLIFADYKKIEGFHLIKEYSLEEFYTIDKKVKVERNKFKIFSEKISFNYFETITIPSYLFDDCINDEIIIYFGIFKIIQNKETGEYRLSGTDFNGSLEYYLKMHFEKTSDNKIIL